ncbi:MAG: histone deacetylase [Planctomycetales bacterium]|nr:histone deacetylase [Planctomycetales bacterium]
MKVFCTDSFQLPLPENHRFPLEKYRLLRQRVMADLGGQVQGVVPAAASDPQLALAHDAAHVHKVTAGLLTPLEQRRIGFPWSSQLVERARRSTGATVQAGRAALVDHVAVNLAGGTHHASATASGGFCVFNDVAVAIRVLQAEGRIRQAIVIDCDVHQGNGTAAIFANDPTVFTFSMHGERNFPFAKTSGDLDIALADGTGDAEYLSVLAATLKSQIPWQTADCVFYLAGADPYQQDRWGRLKLSKDGLRTRDQWVLRACHTAGLPVVITMAGGYARDIRHTVDIQAATVATAYQLFQAATA